MDILHKTQKQHLPLILFFQHSLQLWKKKGHIQKREFTSNSIFFPIQLFKQSQRGKKEKKEEISLNNKTFAFNHHFCLENV